MGNLIIMCGLPGSGKSYIVKEYSQNSEDSIVISTDDIRKEITGDESSQEKNTEVFDLAFKRIKSHLQNNYYRNVVFDATNINYKKRMDIINRFKKYANLIECYFVYADYDECIDRNANRDRKVPEEVIKSMYFRFYVPQLFEGFDYIRFINNSNNTHRIEELKQKLDINQENPNHKLSLLEHSKRTRHYLEKNKADKIDSSLILTGYLHDIGKIKTKTFINAKGEKTDIAHYYNHEKVGAYDSFAYTEHLDLGERLYIAKLIQWHMLLHNKELTEKTINKYREKLGKQFWTSLEILHDADLDAH